MKKELYLLRGLPGSGKSTLAKSLGGNHIEADMYYIQDDGTYKWDPSKIREAHEWCQNTVREWLTSGVERIVVSNTFTKEWEMAPYQTWAQDFGYTVFSLVVENRHGGKNIHNVPDETLKAMKERFEIKL